jgi:putative transposase
LRVCVHPANEPDSFGGRLLLQRLPLWQRLKAFLFDSGYLSPAFHHWCEKVFSVEVQITNRGEDKKKGFVVQPKRWVVERSFAWLNRFRRLSKDFEQRPQMSEAFIYLSMIQLMLRRLTRIL